MGNQQESQAGKPPISPQPVKLPHPTLAYKAVLARSQQLKSAPVDSSRVSESR